MPCRSDPQPPPESAAATPAAECPSAYGATVELIGGSHPGIDKWLGGELAADGCIYGVPGSAKCVLKVDPRTDEVTRLGDLRGLSAIRGGKFKWLRGALDPETGDTFGVPSNGNQVLRIDRAGGIDLLGDPDALQGHWKWHGGVRAANGSLYCCPCNADRVLKIAPASGEVSLVGGPWPGKQKWYGSLLGKDGCMYNVPNCASAVLKFDPASETGTLLGNLPGGGWKWHGAAVGGDGNIYGVPAHARRVLKIVVGSDEVREIGMLLPDTKYKWGGACTAANGDVVCFPSDTGRTLHICCAPGVPEDEQVSLIGPSYPGGNKWQNGFLGRDGAIYGLPCNAPAVLRISPSFEVTTLRLSGGDSCGASLEKWEGGVIAPSGVIYAMPQQADRVLRIDPGARAA